MDGEPVAVHDEDEVAERQLRTTNITVRVPGAVRLRVEQAAAECSMTVSEWLREVVIASLEVHENSDEPTPRLGESDDEYEARRLDGQARREAMELEREPSKTPRLIEARNCPHLPFRRTPSGQCLDCHAVIGRPLSGGARIRTSVGSVVEG